jgi:ribose/xylose/arabinose/galactoside ABC-type transport system permease subunit
MISDKTSFIGRLLSSVEFKLIVSWLLVVLATIALDSGDTYWDQPGNSAQLILRQTVMLGFFALGAAIIIISGGIDLSSGSVIAMSATVFGCLMMTLDPVGFKAGHISTTAVILSIAGTLLSGAMVGTLHAWLITSVGLPPFVATLATLVGLRSFSRGLTQAITATGNSNGKSQIDFTDEGLRNILKNVPYISIAFVAFALLLWFLMSRTVTGRHLQAMGGNEQAAKLSGIRTDRLKWLAYVIGAVSASIVGIISFADNGSAKPDIMARGYELNAIAASVIGGCSLQGGVGTIPGTILGCLFLRTVIDAVQKIVGAGSDVYEGMIVGIVVVVAVTFSQRGSSQLAGKKYFSNAIGWSVIPTLGLLTGLSYVLFFRSREEWFAPYQAYVIAGAVVVALIIRAFIESKPKASGQS